MKTTKRILSLVLALVLVGSLLLTPAMAAADPALSGFTEGTGYVAIGDSITRGFGASADWESEVYEMDDTENPDCRNVTGSYPLLVAQALGCNCPDNITDPDATYWPIAQNATTTAFVLDYLGIDDGYRDEWLYGIGYMRTRYETILTYFGDQRSIKTDGTGCRGTDGSVKSIRDLIENSSLLTINLGMGDVLYRASEKVQEEVSLGDLGSLSAETAAAAVKTVVDTMYEGYQYWQKSFPLLLDYLRESAPSTTVVIVGALNPLFNLSINDEYLIPVGTALSVITAAMNRQYQQWAKEYGFLYVDVSGVETYITEKSIDITDYISGNSTERGLATHPTAKGYQQMADAILNALRENISGQKTASTDIVVDLGRFEDVSAVKVNGHTITEGSGVGHYEMAGSTLTVHYGLATAVKLTVYNDTYTAGKTAMTTYQLAYHLGDGYTAYRIYTTNDVDTVRYKLSPAGLAETGTKLMETVLGLLGVKTTGL